METKNIGLCVIEVADIKISNIDGEKNTLICHEYDDMESTKKFLLEKISNIPHHDQLSNMITGSQDSVFEYNLNYLGNNGIFERTSVQKRSNFYNNIQEGDECSDLSFLLTSHDLGGMGLI